MSLGTLDETLKFLTLGDTSTNIVRSNWGVSGVGGAGCVEDNWEASFR